MVCDLKAYGGKQRAAALGGPLMVGVAGGHLDRYLRPVEATPRTAALTGRVTASAALLVAQGLLSANRERAL